MALIFGVVVSKGWGGDGEEPHAFIMFIFWNFNFCCHGSVKGLFLIQLWVCFRSVFSFFGSVLDLAALEAPSWPQWCWSSLRDWAAVPGQPNTAPITLSFSLPQSDWLYKRVTWQAVIRAANTSWPGCPPCRPPSLLLNFTLMVQPLCRNVFDNPGCLLRKS